jgi:hypothetical protein
MLTLLPSFQWYHACYAVDRYTKQMERMEAEMVNRLVWLFFLIAFLPSLSLAQASQDYRGQGYVFAGPSYSSYYSSALINAGGGGEGFVHKGMSVGGEIGGFVHTGPSDAAFGVISPNVSYHFREASSSGKLVPFVTGGFSLFFKGRADPGSNVGGGLNYWFKDHLGLRIELRDHIPWRTDIGHIVGVRVGLSFR